MQERSGFRRIRLSYPIPFARGEYKSRSYEYIYLFLMEGQEIKKQKAVYVYVSLNP